MKNIEIRDIRKKEKYVVDDEYLNGYARLCGAFATCVYNSLCRHANTSQKSWPSIDLLMEQHNLSRPTIIKAIKTLEKWQIIAIFRSKDEQTKRQNPNVYVLLDKAMWKPKPSKRGELGAESTSGVEPSKRGFKSRVNDVDWKVSHLKETHRRENVKKLLDEERKKLVEKLSMNRS